jgi:cystathionine beta-lyase
MIPNPHNPTGRVFTREELQALAEVAVERDLVVVSDEIHADLVYSGSKHIPFASLGPDVAARTITLTSATKGFNIPGLRCALMHFGAPELQARFHKVFPLRILGQVNVVGIDATVAAWRHGQPWLKKVMARLEQNRNRLTEFMATEMPRIRFRQPEATYLAWLDCRGLELPQRPFEFFLELAKVALLDGATFGATHGQCVRLNFATSEPILAQVLERLAGAVKGALVAR